MYDVLFVWSNMYEIKHHETIKWCWEHHLRANWAGKEGMNMKETHTDINVMGMLYENYLLLVTHRRTNWFHELISFIFSKMHLMMNMKYWMLWIIYRGLEYILITYHMLFYFSCLDNLFIGVKDSLWARYERDGQTFLSFTYES